MAARKSPVRKRPAADRNGAAEAPSSIAALMGGELWWAPARAAAQMLVRVDHNTATMMRINRKLADELRSIVRREQDVALGVCESLFDPMSAAGRKSAAANAPDQGLFAAFYRAAMTGVREYGRAMSEAQACSIEALQQHARVTVDAATRAMSEDRKAT